MRTLPFYASKGIELEGLSLSVCVRVCACVILNKSRILIQK